MKYGIIKVKRAFLYEENGVDVVDEVFFGWSVMWEDEGEWICLLYTSPSPRD